MPKAGPSSTHDVLASLQKTFIDGVRDVALSTTASGSSAVLLEVTGELGRVGASVQRELKKIQVQVEKDAAAKSSLPVAMPVPVPVPAAAAAAASAASAAIVSPAPVGAIGSADGIKYQTWEHPDGHSRSVPPGFELPGRGNTVAMCFRMWFLGDEKERIRPFRDLTTRDFGTCVSPLFFFCLLPAAPCWCLGKWWW